MLKKNPQDKINGTKNALFFFREIEVIKLITFNSQDLYAEAQ